MCLQRGQQCLEMGGMWRWRAERGLGQKAVIEPGQLQGLGWEELPWGMLDNG